MESESRQKVATKASTTRTRRRPSRRIEILRRSAHLFLEKGFEITSLVDIAEAAGISKAGLYYHFSSKQDLLAAIINYGHEVLELEFEKQLADCSTDEEALHRLIYTYALIITREDDAAFANLAVEEMRSLLPADREQIANRKRAFLGCRQAARHRYHDRHPDAGRHGAVAAKVVSTNGPAVGPADGGLDRRARHARCAAGRRLAILAPHPSIDPDRAGTRGLVGGERNPDARLPAY